MVLVAYKLMNLIVLVGLLGMAIHFLHAGRKRATLPGTEESMTTTTEFITALFCQVDDQLAGLPKHPEAHLWPSEVLTLGLLHALKGVGNRPFYRWLTRDGTGSVCCRSIRDLHLSSFLDQEYLLEGEALLQHP